MNSNGQPMNEQQVFDQLLGNDQFDDSAGEQHQHDLRAKVLQAFDQSHQKATVGWTFLSVASVLQGFRRSHQEEGLVQRHEPKVGWRPPASWDRSLGYAAALSICLMGLVTIGFYHWIGPPDRSVVQRRPDPAATGESRLLASLDQVNAFRDAVSPEALFGAIAMCEQEHAARQPFDSVEP